MAADSKADGGLVDRSVMLHSGAQRAFQAHARHCWVALASAPPLFRNLSSLALPERAAKRLKVFSSSVCGPMPPVPLSVTVPAQPSMPLFESTFKIRPMTARDEALRAKAMDSDRKAAIKKWVSLITVAPNCWEVSRLTMQSAQPSDLTGGLLESVIDSFADKSNSTLHSRAGPLVRYVQFWNERGVTCFPVVEVQLYTFVKSLEDPAPTFPNSLLTSLCFAHFVLGLVIVGSAVDSGRIKGAAAAHYARKRQDARRPALTRLQLRRLEDTVLDPSRRGHDRVAAGYFLFLVYGRLRYSDGQRITAMHLDVDELTDSNDGFLECVAERTKTQTGLAKKRKALPVVIPVQSAGRCWIFEWLEVRRQMGLVVSGQNITEPLLPAPATGGRWTRLPLPVSEAAAWLRSLLEGLVTTGDIRVGTHSCKATLLSWCAKKGLGHGPRKLLGYHVPRADRSLVIYSRDELASPMRSLVQLLREVNGGSFDPDLTRSGMLAQDRAGSGAQEEGSDSGSSTEGSSDEEDARASDVEAAVDRVVGPWADEHQLSADAIFVRNQVSRCIHVMRDEAGSHLKCGRKMSTKFELLPEKPAFMNPVCNTCFKSRR